jgi:transcriptional regulator with XRE-family HTH domain
MPEGVIDQQTLYRNLVHVLEHGLRTATYKLATLTALLDICVERKPYPIGGTLDVPISELAKKVIALYWRQSEEFDGVQLRQSTQPSSIILDWITAIRAAAPAEGDDLRLDEAAQLASEVYRRAIDGVGLCLARQPLPRLQRLPGSARSLPFLFDDSFLHDNVTRSELQRHKNAIQLRPGVADGLAALEDPLRRKLQAMWVEDVLRMNRLSEDRKQPLAEHLFESRPPQETIEPQSGRKDAFAPTRSDVTPSETLANATFASRLNRLFDTVRTPEGQQYSSGEVAATMRQSGFPMTVTVVSQLRAGVGPAPSAQTVRALARFFGVSPSYFSDSNDALPVIDEKQEANTPMQESGGREEKQDLLDRVISDDLNDVAAVCEVADNGCWLAPSNRAVRCRSRDDIRDIRDLPEIALHRWAWMIANGHGAKSIPPYLIDIRHRCTGETCCNPTHLYAAVPGGDELSDIDVARLIEKSYVTSAGASSRASSAYHDVSTPSGRFTLTDDLDSMKAHCKIDYSGCWLAPTAGPVACRASGDDRPASLLPYIAFHRWAWLVAHNFARNPLPGNAFQVRRRCTSPNCCNPEHLFLSTPNGIEIAEEDAERWRRSGHTRRQDAVDPNTLIHVPATSTRLVLRDDLASVKAHCSVDDAGCWIAPTANPVACRAHDDDRQAADLPQLAFHRWMWMVAHGYASKPLPGKVLQVRRQCGKSTCCNPAHLFLSTVDGTEVPISTLEKWLGSGGGKPPNEHLTEDSDAVKQDVAAQGGRHRAATSGEAHAPRTDMSFRFEGGRNAGLFATRLNMLFETVLAPDGNPYSAGEVASALQEDGLAISESLISRLREGLGVGPSPRTIEALAYFFNVDSDYFSAGTHSRFVTNTVSSRLHPHREDELRSLDSGKERRLQHAEAIPLSIADLGRIVVGLSEAISECLARNFVEIEKSAQLALLLAQVGALLSAPTEKKVVSRPLLRRIVEEWTSVGRVTYVRQPILALLTQLLDDGEE